MPKNDTKPNRAPDFRYLFSNVIGFAFSDNDCRVTFAIDDGDGADNAYEQVGVAMTHKTAKMLAVTLTELMSDYEAKTGNVIPFDVEKLETLKKMLKEKAAT